MSLGVLEALDEVFPGDRLSFARAHPCELNG